MPPTNEMAFTEEEAADEELAAEEAQDYRYRYENEPSTSQVASVYSQIPVILDPYQFEADDEDDFLSPKAVDFFKSYLSSFVDKTSINST